MKVALVTTSFPRTPYDDAGIFVARLVGSLEQEGVGGLVIAPKDSDEQYQPYSNFKTIRVSYTFFFRRILAFGSGIIPNIKRNPWAVVQIPGLLFAFTHALIRNRHQYQIIHANWLINVLPSVLASIILKKKVVVTARGEDLRLLRSKAVRLLMYPFLARASSIVVVGESLSREFKELLPNLGNKVVTIENGVEPEDPQPENVEALRRRFSLHREQTYLVFVGSIIPRKRIDETIKILSHLEDRSTELLLCGRIEHSEYVEKCKQVARECGVEERVHFLGSLPPSEVWCLLSQSTIFVSSSEFEGRPNAILEALSMGVPVVASKIPAHESVVEHGLSGYLFSSIDDAAQVIDKLLREKQMYSEFSENARKSMNGRGWKRVAGRYVELYRSVISAGAYN